MLILLIADDPARAAALMAGLEAQGICADRRTHAEASALRVGDGTHAAAVVDHAGAPSRGPATLRTLRGKDPDLPIVALLADDDAAARVRGLDAGADDCLASPVDMDELAARLRARLRRLGTPHPGITQAAGLELDICARRARRRGVEVSLAPREVDLLMALMEAAGRPLSRQQLAARMHVAGAGLASNAVEVHVHHLRRKLGADLIRTIRGVGYALPGSPPG